MPIVNRALGCGFAGRPEPSETRPAPTQGRYAMWSSQALASVSTVVVAVALLAGCQTTQSRGALPVASEGALPAAKITRPGLVAVDVRARREQLISAGAMGVQTCQKYVRRPLPGVLHELVGTSEDVDDRFLPVAAKLRELGARCLIEDKAACTTIQDYALDWARNSKLGGPSGGYDDNIYWEETLTINMRLLAPMIAALSVAEQFSPLESSARETLNQWLKRKVDQYEHGLRKLGRYKGGRHGTTARRAANNHAIQSSIAAMSYGAWVNDRKYFKTGLEQWFITLGSMRSDGSLPIETRRGARALFYHGRTIAGLIQLAERAAVQGIDLYGSAPGPKKTIHHAVTFFIDAMEQPDLVLKYARTNRHGTGKNYKIQDLGSIESTMGWIAPYIARFPNHPNSRRLLARRPSNHSEVSNYLTDLLDLAVRLNGQLRGVAGEWIGVDAACFYADPRYL